MSRSALEITDRDVLDYVKSRPDLLAQLGLSFAELRRQNVSRRDRWHDGADDWTGADWSNAMAGEAGEACNIVKKIRRWETGAGTGYNTPGMEFLVPALAEELADVVTYCDLLADKFDIDLGRAVAEKFNRVSEAQDFPERLVA